MLPFLAIGTGTALYMLWALMAYPLHIFVRGNSIVYINDGTNNTAVAVLYVIATCGSLFFSKVRDMVIFGAANLAILLVVMAVEAVCVHFGMVRVYGGGKRDHPRLLLEESDDEAVPVWGSGMVVKEISIVSSWPFDSDESPLRLPGLAGGRMPACL
jgi:hypothetical protein